MSLLSFFHIEHEDSYHKERIKLVYRLSMLLAVLFLAMTIIELFSSYRNAISYLVCSVIPIFCLVYTKKTLRYQVAYIIFCTFGTLIAFITLNYYHSEYHFGEFLWMIFIIVLAFWGLNNRMGFLFTAINIISFNFYLWINIQNNFNELREIDNAIKFSLSIELTVVFLSVSFVVYQFVSLYRFSMKNMKLANQKLTESNQFIYQKQQENITLLKEVHHRVKNNLQIIVSLLRLQKHNANPQDAQKFEDSINRVMSMALIHRKLYQSDNLSEVDTKSYLQELVNEIANSYSIHNNVTTEVNSSYKKIGLNTIVPLGLIANELLTNSFKHAFKNSNDYSIHITIKELSNNFFEFIYTDSGIWNEPQIDKQSFGIELISTLTEQLEGSFERNGSTFIFKLKNIDLYNH